MLSQQFKAMSCDVVLLADGETEAIPAGFQRTRAFIKECEQRFSRFIDTSELSRLNASPGSVAPGFGRAVRAVAAFQTIPPPDKRFV